MSAHAIGSATISFGLVSVPIKLFSAGEPTTAVSFNWLHKTDGSRLKQQYFCPKDGEVVDKDGMIKGYEFSKGQYVKFTAEELKALDERGTGAIDVKEFLPAEQVDRIFLEKTYFLGPDKGGERAYRLLAEALKKTGRVAIGQYAARGKGYLIMIRPIGGRLAMEQLRYADELRSIDEVPVGEVEIKPAELSLAVQFIEQAATEQFRPEAYEDKVRQRILEAIQKKVEGQEIVEAPEEAPKTQIIDLMEALKASLAKGKQKEEKEERPAKKRARG